MTLRTLIITLLFVMLSAARGTAGESVNAEKDSILIREYGKMHEFFHTKEKDSMYNAVAKYKARSLELGDMHDFYKAWMNEILYDINFNHFYKAMKKTVEMGKDMRWRDCPEELPNASYIMGVIYSLQGNNVMAKRCLRQALDETPGKDAAGKIKIYKELANIEIDYTPEKAIADIDTAMLLAKDNNLKYDYSAVVGFKIIIGFFMKDHELVKKYYNLYTKLKKEYGNDFCSAYETYVLMALHTARSEYDKAIRQADLMTNIDKFKMKTKIYEFAGDTAAAYKAQLEYTRIKDSINGQTMFQDIHELTEDMESTKISNKERRNRLVSAIQMLLMCSAVIAIVALAFVIRNRNRFLAQLKRKNHELEAMRDKAMESDRMKVAIQRNMSHEIRTPLNIISGFAQIIGSPEMELTANERADMAARITANSDRIVKIINDLLYVSMESSVSYVEKSDLVTCRELCAEAISKFTNNNSADESIILRQTVDDKHKIRTNKTGVLKILNALLDNARKFSADGKIYLDCHADDAGKTVRLSVTNAGTGIPKDYIDKVFDPFFKIDNYREGLGLGLPLSKQIVGQLGGDITIDTGYTEGARIVVTLPFDEE